ncbi:MAG: NHL repeat-containing protein [Pseudomonadota bacterium]
MTSNAAGQILVSHGRSTGGTRIQTFNGDGQYQFEYALAERLDLIAQRADGGLYGAGDGAIYLYDPPASGQPADPPELTATISQPTFLSQVILVGNEGEDQLVIPSTNPGFPPSLGPFNTQSGVTQSIAVADLDNDRQLDFVFGRTGQNAILLGDFPALINTDVALGTSTDDTRAVVAADVDGNGSIDIVTANADAANRVFLNDGSANFSAGSTFGAGDDTRALAAADVDDNGTMDLFVGNAAGQSRIYLGDGAGGFTAGQLIGGPSDTILAAGFADVDRSGTFDLVIARNGSNQVFANIGGTFAAPTNLTEDVFDSRDLAFADINTDGYVDVVVGNFDQVNRYYLNDGTGGGWSGFDVGSEAEATTAIAVYVESIFPVLAVGNVGQADRLYFRDQFGNTPFSRSAVLPDDGDMNTRALATAPDISQRSIGELTFANSLVIGPSGNFYVHDFRLRKVIRYSASGQVLAETRLDPAPGEAALIFNGVGVDSNERLYVSDGYNNRIYRYAPPLDLNGNDPHTLEATFGEPGTGDGELDAPAGIQVLSTGNLAISDRQNRVQIFSPDGQFLSTVGRFGSIPGAFGSVDQMAELDDGRLVTVDRRFSRVQTFNPQIVSDNTKVIMVAGGGPYPGNALWDATQNNANFAYRVLVSQGFTKETIFYLSDDTDLDLDGNGLPDDVDGAASVANLAEAFATFAADAENLIVYLIDHGGLDTFRMSGTETLSAGAVGTLLDNWQGAGVSRGATLIYDACQSGSFLDETRSDQFDRIVITSSGADENAYFVSQGTLSFSNQFWTHIFNGLSLEDAFTLASQTQSTSFPQQTPMVESDGDGVANSTFDLARLAGQFIGNGTQIFGEVPEIGSVSVSPPSGSSATVDATNVTDGDGIGRVWMVLRPPGFNPGSPDNPVQDLPTVELARDPGTDNFSASFNGFTSEGTYQLTVYAQDAVGNTAVPQVAFLTIDNPLRRKAIIVAGGEPSDSEAEPIRINAALAYSALLQQGYGPDGSTCNQSLCDDIQYLSNTGIAGLDAAATLANLEFAITDWATQDGQDLALYLVGVSEGGGLRLNSGEVLTAVQLSAWLDTAQAALPGPAVVVYDGELSGDFVPVLAPPAGEDRIVIASDGDTLRCNLVLDEDISFSRFFWGQVLNGATVRQAFNIARQGIRFSERSQRPLLDDNGNGIGNEFTDGLFARSYSLGSGVLLAGDEPLIASVNAPATIDGVTAVELVADGVTSTGEILSVEAIVTLPNCEEVRLPMQNNGGGNYSVQTQIFSDFSGIHDVAVVARDDEGLSSLPAAAQVDQLSGSKLFADSFE